MPDTPGLSSPRWAQRAPCPRISLTEDVARTARRLHDPALLAQAYLAMGHELAACGHLDHVRNRFTATHQLLEYTDIRVIDVFAERALYNLEYSTVH